VPLRRRASPVRPQTAHVSGGSISINNANVITANIIASNGVIHIVDHVLVPTNFVLPAKDIVQTALGVASLSTLVTAVEAANVTADLSMPNGPYTVFAPTCVVAAPPHQRRPRATTATRPPAFHRAGMTPSASCPPAC